jgi:cold shock CspA family protein
MKGKISKWNDKKGFGFIVSDDGVEKVFFHISSLKTSTRRPQVGDSVVYESSLDAKNRLQTKAVVIEGLVAQVGTQHKSQFIQVIPPQKNAFDYFLILVLLGCLGKAGWNFYHTHLLNESIAPYAISAIAAFIILNWQKKPNQKQFNCARCGAIANFDSRTIQAWNNGFMKLYCNTCHQRWLRENPVQPTHSYSVGRGSGCLVLLCVLAIAPVLAGVASALILLV